MLKELSLNKIESLKSKKYNEIISELYYDIDLFNLDDIKISSLEEYQIKDLKIIYNKMNSNDISSESNESSDIVIKKKKLKKKKKKKKNNKIRNDGMRLLLSLEVSEPSLLYFPYKKVYKNNNEYFNIFLYSINISSINFIGYGFIFPMNLGQNIKIKLIEHRSHEISYCKLEKLKNINIEKNDMKLILYFHYYICLNLLQGKKTIKCDLLNTYLNSMNISDKFKKYYFVPLIKNKYHYDLDFNKMNQCFDYSEKKFDNKIFPRMDLVFNRLNRKEIEENFKDNFIITDYKINSLYEFNNVVSINDDADTFIKYYTLNDYDLFKIFKNKLKDIYNNSKYKLGKKFEELTAKEIIEEIYLNEDEMKGDLGGIVGYRKIPSKYKIKVNNTSDYYIMAKFGSLNLNKLNYIYTSNVIRNDMSKNLKNIKKMSPINGDNSKNKYAKILPPDRIINYFLNKKDMEIFEKIPSIFTTFEGIMKIKQFIYDYNLLENKNIEEKKQLEKGEKFLKWGFTTIGCLQDYNYETIETLGDSILKMISTICVYHIHEFNNLEDDVKNLVFNRATLICNLHLYDIGLTKKLYNYIYEYSKEITCYNFPLQTEFLLTSKLNVTEKIIADLVESSMGSIFLMTKSLNDCFNYFMKLEIPFVEEGKKKYNLTKGIFSKNYKWKSGKKYEELVKMSYEEFNRKIKDMKNFKFPNQINDIINMNKLEKNICIRNLMEQYLFECINEKEKYNEMNNNNADYLSLEYLQQCRLFYKFKDINNLIKAMTFKSKNLSASENYEKLELLGDSIVESFISQYTFSIFSKYLYLDKDDSEDIKNLTINNKKEQLIIDNATVFNNKYMTHVKSYLCSNYFMCKLSVLVGLPHFIQFGSNDITNIENLKKFLEPKNIEKLLESDMSNYAPTDIFQPKFIADLFESIIGAIYVDSDLNQTFNFLNKIYGPSICYSCLFLKELPFSIVADFTERCSKELNVVPSFKKISEMDIEEIGLEYDQNKIYLKLEIGSYFNYISEGDSEEKAKENASEEGIKFLDNIKYQGPEKKNKE